MLQKPDHNWDTVIIYTVTTLMHANKAKLNRTELILIKMRQRKKKYAED